MTLAQEHARFIQSYAKDFHVGAFGTPTASEIATHLNHVLTYKHGDDRTVIYWKQQTRTTERTEWTGGSYHVPKGWKVAQHVARSPLSAEIPQPIRQFDMIFAYAEDFKLVHTLTNWGFVRVATRITAASEIINVMVHPSLGAAPARYAPYDLATVTELPMGDRFDLDGMLTELANVSGWYDDYPFYSDGTWSAVSLRGFYPQDPSLSVKPSEMPKKWKQEHPADLGRKCDWTVLAEKCPAMTRFARAVSDVYGPMERVRLMKMSGRGGKGGKLGRHTDITDRNAGTKDGQIVRIHVPLVTERRIKMLAWDLDGNEIETHLPVGRMFYLDQRKPHAVINPTPHDRVHLTIDVVSNPVLRDALDHAYREDVAL